MDSKELLKKYPEIKKELMDEKPRLWIKFSVFKNKVDNIPEDAETTPKKVFLYLDASTGTVHFSTNGEPYIQESTWNPHYCIATYSDKYDCIILSKWSLTHFKDYKEKHFKGKAPFDLKNTMQLSYFILVNNKKEVVATRVQYVYSKSMYMSMGEPSIGNISDFWGTYGYRELLEPTCINLANAFEKVFKIGLVGGNTYLNFDSAEEISKFLNYKEPVVRDTPKQRLLNDLLKINLVVPKMKFNNASSSKFICVASKVNEEYSALRWFIKTKSGEPYEVSRLYVTKKTHLFCRKNTCGDYIVLNNKLSSSSFDAQRVMIQDKDAFDGTKLEYFTSIYKDLQPSERSAALYMLTVFPEFEKMYKSNFKKICTNYLHQIYQQSWPQYLNSLFGTYNPKEKNLNKMFGFNKHQLEVINTATIKNRWEEGIGYKIKRILETQDCSDIDNATFDAIFDALCAKCNYKHYMEESLRLTIQVYSLKTCLNMIPKLKEIANVVRSSEVVTPYGYTYRATLYGLMLYADYVRTVGQLNAANRMRPQFNTIDDIQRMHDDAAAVLNVKRNMIEVENFKKRIDVWKKWEFDDDEKYAVIIPLIPEDIATEGITLHHCVKSYIQRVAQGMTNIVFIREKTDLEAPFFTVEVSNMGTIEQIHGFANRNVSSEPGLDKFVKKWAKAKKLNTSNFNKVR